LQKKNNFDAIGGRFKAYAEVWGTENGVKKPIAWVSGMTLGKKYNDDFSFDLKLNLKWASKVNAIPDELRNVFIQNSENSVTITQMDSISLKKKLKKFHLKDSNLMVLLQKI